LRENLRPDIRVAVTCRIHRTAVLDLSYGGSITIGKYVEVGPGAVISSQGGHVVIGDDVYIGSQAIVHGNAGLTIGRSTMLGPRVTIIPADHGIAANGVPMREQPMKLLGVTVEDDCWLGAGVIVLDGVTLGSGCVIGAGSVVTRSVGKMMIAYGVPAREHRRRT
jgi:acetyltransferase-like isoleucine patch superfamily enzyme